jgi:uncharacterized protein (DUF2336 family)
LSASPQSVALLELARSRDPADRGRLLQSIVKICEDSDARQEGLDPAVKALVESIFMALVVEAEHEIRRRLADRLAIAAWAPPALINVLALDDIDVARPIIAASPVLKDEDLIRLLVEATIEHQIEVARRPKLAAPVVQAILARDEPAVLTALASNDTAEITSADMARLVETSRRIAALRAPLARHPRLNADLAGRLYAWVGQSLRTAIVARFDVDPKALDAAIAQAANEAHGNVGSANAPTVVWERQGEQEEMERRLIDKLSTAGQLRPGYLLRVLKEKRLSLFETALAHLGGFDPLQIRKAVASPDKPELLGLACAAVGIDRGAFPTILAMVRDLNDGRPGGGDEGERRAIGAFGPFANDIAASAFRKAIAAA